MTKVKSSLRTVILSLALVFLCAASGACRKGSPHQTSPLAGARPAAPPARVAASPSADDGQWLAPAKDYANTRFSGLDQINAGNVGRL
ncbi:MAG TPA: hypothetical protein VIY96_05010, partial [Thermoanaerobaculia bacterium]